MTSRAAARHRRKEHERPRRRADQSERRDRQPADAIRERARREDRDDVGDRPNRRRLQRERPRLMQHARHVHDEERREHVEQRVLRRLHQQHGQDRPPLREKRPAECVALRLRPPLRVRAIQRRLGHARPHPDADADQQARGEERDSPSPIGKRRLAQRHAEQREHGRRQHVARRRRRSSATPSSIRAAAPADSRRRAAARRRLRRRRRIPE